MENALLSTMLDRLDEIGIEIGDLERNAADLLVEGDFAIRSYYDGLISQRTIICYLIKRAFATAN